MKFKRDKYINALIEKWRETVVEHEAVIGTYDVMLADEKDEMKKRPTENARKQERERLENSHIMLDVLNNMKNGVKPKSSTK